MAEQYVIEVVSLVSIPRPEAQILSYYSGFSPAIGSLINVPFRNRQVPAVVLNSLPLAQAKITLKKEFSFDLRQAGKTITEAPVLNEKQQALAFWLASQYYAPLGASFKAVLPPFAGKKKFPINSPKTLDLKRETPGKRSFLMINDPALHYKKYLEPIKQKAKKQILLLVPETTHLDYFAEKFTSADWRIKPEILNSGLSNQKYYEIYQKVSSGKPILLISTRVGCFLPWQNLGLIILDHESNYAYRSDTTPKYHTADLARELAKRHGSELIISDTLPRLETFHELGLADYKLKTINYKLINLVSEIKDANYSPFSRELQEKILAAIDKKQKIILFVPRKGYALYLLCNNCGYIARCEKCDSVMVVHSSINHKLKTINCLGCHRCENIQPMQNTCPKCQRAILEYKGLAIQKAMEKLSAWLSRVYSSPPLQLELSNDTAPDRKAADKILAEFSSGEAKILFTTQKIFSYLYPTTGLPKADLIAILNADMLSSFVDFRADEEALRDLITLTKLADQTIIQTYHPDAPPLKALAENKINEFMDGELANRRTLGYPPFSELIKLTFRHRKSEIAECEAKIMSERLKLETRNYNLKTVILGPNPGLKEKGLHTQEIILKSKLETKKRNTEVLRLLTRGWQAEVTD